MLELTSIKYKDYTFIGLKIGLPKQPIYIVFTTHCILVGLLFQLEEMSEDIAIIKCCNDTSFISLLDSEIIEMNKKAKQLGYSFDMKGSEGLVYSIIKKNKDKI